MIAQSQTRREKRAEQNQEEATLRCEEEEKVEEVLELPPSPPVDLVLALWLHHCRIQRQTSLSLSLQLLHRLLPLQPSALLLLPVVAFAFRSATVVVVVVLASLPAFAVDPPPRVAAFASFALLVPACPSALSAVVSLLVVVVLVAAWTACASSSVLAVLLVHAVASNVGSSV